MFSLAIGLGLACGSVASLFIAPNLLLALQPTQPQTTSPGRAGEAAAFGEGRSS
jgi:preprotein translocase subunit SecF